MKRMAMVLLLSGLSLGTALAECQVRYSARVGTRSDGVVANAKAGQACFISAYLNSPTMRASGTTLQGIEVVRQPRNGQVRTEGSAFTYTPNAKFSGKDSFFIRFRFTTSAGQPRMAGVRFAVSG